MKFDERYKVYLDITAQKTWVWNDDTNANWVEISPDVDPFPKSLFEDEQFLRHQWGKVNFRNEPYQSEFLYTVIENLNIAQEIRIKIVTSNNVIRGYFGNNDCDFNDDEQVLFVTPSVLDQYTDLLENAEKKTDVIGGSNSFNARMDAGTSLIPIIGSHSVPLDTASSDIDELNEPDKDALPNNGGAFLANTKSAYSAEFNFTIEANLVVAVGQTFQFQFREYDSNNNLLAESSLTVYDGSSSGISLNTTFNYSPAVSQFSYITLECIFSDESSSISYINIDFNIFLASTAYSTITVDVNLLATSLVPLQVWSELIHGRASPKESEWESTDGVVDYFDEITGKPLANGVTGVDGRFDDVSFGPAAGAWSSISNNKDLYNEPIGGLRLSDVISAIESYQYQVSSVTVFEGTTYRQWSPFGTKKRRVFATCTFSREEYMKTDEGAPDPPPGDGWEQTDYFENNQRLWVRVPFNDVVEDWDLGDLDSSGGINSGFEWISKLTSIRAYPDGDDSRQFDTTRKLRDVLQTIYNGASDLLVGKGVESTFLFNDNESELPFYDSQPTGTNYVSMRLPNELNRIGCIHTKNFDTTDNDITSEDRILELSFNDMIDDMKKLWPIFWFIDEDGTLHIEHEKYIDLKRITNDVRGIKSIDETKKWAYDKSRMFETIEYYMANSNYVDFTNNNRTFDKIASNKRNQDLKLELTTEYLSTDIKYCIESASDLDNGLTLIAYDENNVMINAYVPILGQIFENGELAISNLLNRYWQYEGVWLTGKINGIDTEFIKSARTKTGKPISLKNILNDNEDGDEINFLTTYIGIGMIKSMKQDFNTGMTDDIILLYRFDSDPEADSFVLIAATDVLYDFGNYEN